LFSLFITWYQELCDFDLASTFLSSTDYVLDIKKYVDLLAAIGSLISNDDRVEATLEGLLEEFDDFITAILSSLDPYTVEEVEALLLSQEEQFDKHIVSANTPIEANLVSGNQSHKSNFGGYAQKFHRNMSWNSFSHKFSKFF